MLSHSLSLSLSNMLQYTTLCDTLILERRVMFIIVANLKLMSKTRDNSSGIKAQIPLEVFPIRLGIITIISNFDEIRNI